MPGVITVPEFIRETREDYTSPTTSTFVNRIPQCRETINKIDEVRIVKRVILHTSWDHPMQCVGVRKTQVIQYLGLSHHRLSTA